jgi:hypothetical protein
MRFVAVPVGRVISGRIAVEAREERGRAEREGVTS